MWDINHRAIVVLTIACILLGILLIVSKNSDESTIGSMMEQRADIIENTLSGKITFKEGSEMLKLIEEDKLYTDDIKNIKESIESDYSEDDGQMNILSVKKKQQVSDVITYNSEIQWTYVEDGTVYYRNNDYNIGVKGYNNSYKLVSFELIE